MQRAIGIFLICIGSTFLSIQSYGQGCSDAGFCTMGAMRPDQAYSKRIALKLRSLEVNFYRGKSLLTPVIYVTTIDMTVGLNDRNYFQVKLPYQKASGSLGELAGMGDISLSFTHTLKHTENWSLNGTLGTKIPMGDGNAKTVNENTGGVEAPLHMYYQPSLGSVDAIAGLSWINDKWMMATGIQIAMTRNKNQFLWSSVPDYPNPTYVQKYNTGPELLRGIDVMLRVERNFRFTNWNFSIGVLPIWRITKDNTIVPDPNAPKDEWKRGDREGTTGMALTALGSFGYRFDVNSSLKLIRGQKITDREFNPDGLTRHSVWSFSYVYQF